MSKNPDFMLIDKKCRQKGSTAVCHFGQTIYNHENSVVPFSGIGRGFKSPGGNWLLPLFAWQTGH
eukprot:548000-Pelagomonas_calceolata.AAC.1